MAKVLPMVFLSRRNLLTLLSKLDRKAKGEETMATLIKCDNPNDSYRPSMDAISVTAVEDADYYSNRPPGEVLPADDPDRKG